MGEGEAERNILFSIRERREKYGRYPTEERKRPSLRERRGGSENSRGEREGEPSERPSQGDTTSVSDFWKRGEEGGDKFARHWREG